MGDVFDTLVGRLVVERGWVTQDQLLTCLKECGSDISGADTTSLSATLSDILIQKGYVRTRQLDELKDEVQKTLLRDEDYAAVRDDDVVLGRLLSREKILDRDAVNQCLSEQKEQHKRGDREVMRLGEILIAKGLVSFNDIKRVVKLQEAETQADVPSPVRRPSSDSTQQTVLAANASQVPKEVRDAAAEKRNIFGKYVLVHQLGQGGMGIVYKAWDSGLHRWVAIKMLVGGHVEDFERFHREAQTAGQLSHPNIVGVFEVDVIQDRHFIAMEFVEGDALTNQRFPVRKALDLIREIALAVEYAHSKGIIHRDIKPHNIMLDRTGKPFVMDFGLAKSITKQSSVTVSGAVVGTPSYMPPEQAKGLHHQIKQSSDVYSLGAVLYEMLTGRPPFKAGSAVETLNKVVNEEPEPARNINSAVTREVEVVLQKAMDKDRNRRYATARLFAEDIERLQEGKQIQAKPLSLGARIGRRLRRHAVIVAAAAVVLAVIGGVLITGAVKESNRKARVAELLVQADAAFGLESWDKARTLYERILDLEPEHVYAAGRHDSANRKFEEEKAYDELQKRRKEEAERLLKERREALTRARPDFETGKNRYEEALRDLYRSGATLTEMHKTLEKAVRRFDKALGVAPHYAEAWHLRGRANLLLHKHKEADADLTRAIKAKNDFKAALLDRGVHRLNRFLQQIGFPKKDAAPHARLANALSDLKRAVELSADTQEKRFVRAFVAYAEQNMDEAIRLLDKIIDGGGRNELYFLLRGDCWAHKAALNRTAKNGQSALDDFTRALKIRTNFPAALHGRAQILMKYNKDTEAQKDIQLALNLDPSDPDSWYWAAYYTRSIKKPAESLKYLQKTIALDPEHFNAHNMVGVLLLEDRQPAKSIPFFDKAIGMNPTNLTVQSNREIARHRSGKSDDALRKMTELVNENPGHTILRRNRGIIHLERKEYRKALDDFEGVIRMSPASKADLRKLMERARKGLQGD